MLTLMQIFKQCYKITKNIFDAGYNQAASFEVKDH